MPPEIQRLIDKLYADLKPLMDEYGMRPRSIEERYHSIQQRKQQQQQLVDDMKSMPKRNFPKL